MPFLGRRQARGARQEGCCGSNTLLFERWLLVLYPRLRRRNLFTRSAGFNDPQMLARRLKFKYIDLMD
jgi:hypothetical protein